MRRLIREGNPPSGQPASPVPQYWNPSTETFEDVLGAHGAPRAILYGPNGQPIGTQTNPLDVRVRELEAKLDELKQTIESGVQLKGRLQIMDRIAGIVHELGPGETYKTERPLDASMIQSDIATIVVSGQANAKRDIDVYVSMRPLYSHETEKMLVYSSLEDAVPQPTHVFNIVLQYPEFYLHVTNRSSSTFTLQNISLVGRGVR